MEPLWLEMHCCMPSTPTTQLQQTHSHTYGCSVQCHWKHPNGNRINVNKISFNEKISSILGNSQRVSAAASSWLILSMRLFSLYRHHRQITHHIRRCSRCRRRRLRLTKNSLKSVCSLQCQCISLLLCCFHDFRHFTYCISFYVCSVYSVHYILYVNVYYWNDDGNHKTFILK